MLEFLGCPYDSNELIDGIKKVYPMFDESTCWIVSVKPECKAIKFPHLKTVLEVEPLDGYPGVWVTFEPEYYKGHDFLVYMFE